MKQTGLGFLIQHFREQRRVSLRELGRLAQIDHAYIHRLEQGNKRSPSKAILYRLIRALQIPRREANMLNFLVANPKTARGLVLAVINDPTVSFNQFAAAAGVTFNCTTDMDYIKVLTQTRQILTSMRKDE